MKTLCIAIIICLTTAASACTTPQLLTRLKKRERQCKYTLAKLQKVANIPEEVVRLQTVKCNMTKQQIQILTTTKE